MPSSIAPFSPTKSMIASAPEAVGHLPDLVDVRAVDLDRLVGAQSRAASASAGSEGSITMISAGVIAFRHWMPM